MSGGGGGAGGCDGVKQWETFGNYGNYVQQRAVEEQEYTSPLGTAFSIYFFGSSTGERWERESTQTV